MSIPSRVTAIINKESRNIVYRRVTGSGKAINPPVVQAPSVNGLTAIGATAIAFKAPAGCVGQLRAGDKFTIAGDVTVYTISGTVQSLSPPASGFAAVPFAPALVSAAADGAVVTFAWAADKTIRANMQGYPSQLVNGTSILFTDLNVKIAGDALPFTAADTDRLIDGASELKIVRTNPRYAADVVALYDMQARA